MITLGQRIRHLRAGKDISLREFAKKLGGLSAAFISDVELGKRHPSDTVLADMAKVLGTTIDDLKRYDSRPPVDELKRMSNANPAFGFAFRRLVDKDVSAEKLLEFIDKQPNKKKKV